MNSNKKYTIEAFSYRQMMYSRRKLLSLVVGIYMLIDFDNLSIEFRKILPKKNDFNFPYHYILAYVDEKYGYFLLGGCDFDNCYQFKRYMSIVKRLDSNYANTSYEYVPFDKNKFLSFKKFAYFCGC